MPSTLALEEEGVNSRRQRWLAYRMRNLSASSPTRSETSFAAAQAAYRAPSRTMAGSLAHRRRAFRPHAAPARRTSVVLRDGFSVASGASFSAGTDPALDGGAWTFDYQDAAYFLTSATGPWGDLAGATTRSATASAETRDGWTDSYVYTTPDGQVLTIPVGLDTGKALSDAGPAPSGARGGPGDFVLRRMEEPKASGGGAQVRDVT